MFFEEQEQNDQNITPKTLGGALLLHALVMLAFFIGGCIADTPSETIIPIDMTVVPPWAEQSDDPDPDPNPPPPEPKPQPPESKPVVKEDPPPHVDSKVDAVEKIVEKKKPEKKEVPKKKEFKKSEKVVNPKDSKKDEPKKKEFKRSNKVVKAPPTTKYGNAKAKDKPLSEKDFLKALNNGARIGSSNQLSVNEESRCASLIQKRIYECWSNFSYSENLRPVPVFIKFGAGGRVLTARRQGTSGDASVDRSIDDALKRVGYVAGLSAEFLRKFSSGVEIEMVVKR